MPTPKRHVFRIRQTNGTLLQTKKKKEQVSSTTNHDHMKPCPINKMSDTDATINRLRT